MTTNAARLVLLFALLGLGSSAAAAYIHYQILVDPSYQSICDVSATVNCTAVYSSRFGSIGGVSVAVLGAIWFALATLLSVMAMRASEPLRQSAAEYLFAGSTVSLAVVFYLGYASFVLLHMVCVLCVVTYVAVAGLFLVSGAWSTMSLASLPRRLGTDLRALGANRGALVIAAALALTAFVAIALFPRDSSVGLPAGEVETDGGAPPGFEQWYAELPRVSMNPAPAASGADVVIVKFNDYQCPPCRQTHMNYQSVFAKYEASHPGRVRYILRDFPLESECNSLVRTDLHPASCEAAVAVRLAREQGRDKEFEAWLFQNQQSMTPEMVKEGVRTIAGVTNFDERYEGTLEAVRADIQSGIDIGARSTPTFVINGVMIAGGVPPEVFDYIITRELERAAPTAPAAS